MTSADFDRGLVYDIGMHRGEDTAHYLSRGYRVVGVEANPVLVGRLRERFAEQLGTGQLVIIDKALASERGRMEFVVNEDVDEWGTLSTDFSTRYAGLGTRQRRVAVDAIRLDDVLNTHGVPYYMKLDIEGLDLTCLACLQACSNRPAFVSVESVVGYPAPRLRDVAREIGLLWRLGYRRFLFVDQTSLDRLDGRELRREGTTVRYRYESGASGPFGRDIDRRWRTVLGVVPAAVGRLFLQLFFFSGLRTRLNQWRKHQIGFGAVVIAAAGVLARQAFRRRGGRLIRHRWWDLHAALPGATR